MYTKPYVKWTVCNASDTTITQSDMTPLNEEFHYIWPLISSCWYDER